MLIEAENEETFFWYLDSCYEAKLTMNAENLR